MSNVRTEAAKLVPHAQVSLFELSPPDEKAEDIIRIHSGTGERSSGMDQFKKNTLTYGTQADGSPAMYYPYPVALSASARDVNDPADAPNLVVGNLLGAASQVMSAASQTNYG